MRVCALPTVSIRAGFCADSRVYYIPLRGKKQGEPLGGQQKKLRHAVKRQRGAVCNFFLQGLFCQLGTHAGQGRFDHAVHIVVLVLTQTAAKKDLAADCQRLLNQGTDLLHFDVMDGHFVPNISFGAPVLECLHKALPEVFYDVHLMISDPVKYAPDFAKAGANLITFHLEAVPDAVPETIAAIRAAGCQVGISIKPGTPAEAVYPYLDDLDLVLVMSVEPGFGGQKFMPSALDKLSALRAERDRRGLHTLLEVDGGVNTETGPQCAAAGADWLVTGSALFKAKDPAAVIDTLHGSH